MVECLYAASLQVILKRKAMSAFTSIPMELVPKSDGGKIQLDVELPQGEGL
jgi:multidrug efflux pump subunit AcrB